MSQYRVEKRAVEAVLLLNDGSYLAGSLYLAPLSPNHLGPQTVADLMGEPEPVVPFSCADGRFVLVGKPSVAAIRMTSSPTPAAELLVRVAARVRTTGGHDVEGHLLAEHGAGERAKELVNTPDSWLRFEAAGHLHWIAKHHLVTLEPLEG